MKRDVLATIVYYPDVTASEVEQSTGLAHGTVHGALTRLRANGLIRRWRDDREGRRPFRGWQFVYRYRATQKGADRLAYYDSLPQDG